MLAFFVYNVIKYHFDFEKKKKRQGNRERMFPSGGRELCRSGTGTFGGGSR